jgi:hypothetical protein
VFVLHLEVYSLRRAETSYGKEPQARVSGPVKEFSQNQKFEHASQTPRSEADAHQAPFAVKLRSIRAVNTVHHQSLPTYSRPQKAIETALKFAV